VTLSKEFSLVVEIYKDIWYSSASLIFIIGVAPVMNLYDFIYSLCKDRDMKAIDLQKKLGVSRTTLYRFMKGINTITQSIAQDFISALNMDMQESLEFARLISLSSFDKTLIESRYVMDDFLFGKSSKPMPRTDVDMVLYDNDKYMRTLQEVLELIYSFIEKDNLTGNIKIYNCLNESIFVGLEDFFGKILSENSAVSAEHFIGFSETDYLQNIYAFINIIPLMRCDGYSLYFREKEIEDNIANDSILISFKYNEDGKAASQYFYLSFYESSMSECIAFDDKYMYAFLSKRYDNLKQSFKNTIKKYDRFDFTDDFLVNKVYGLGELYMIKPNPCYDQIPFEVYESIQNRMAEEDIIRFLSFSHGKPVNAETAPVVLENVMRYIKTRWDNARAYTQKAVFSKQGIADFMDTGKITDHLPHLPAFQKSEAQTVLHCIRDRDADPDDGFSLSVTENELLQRDMVFIAVKGYGIIIEYVYPEETDGLWKFLFIQSERLASIFCDYVDNHIPVHRAMSKEKRNDFLQSLIGG